MSVNCIRCVKNCRTGPDLLCDDCRRRHPLGVGKQTDSAACRPAATTEEARKYLTLELKALVGDRIAIPTLELKDAVVVGVYVGRFCTTYDVAYFHNGDRKTAYLYDHEFNTTE